MRSAAFAVILVLSTGLQQEAGGQTLRQLAAADSVALRMAVLQIMLDSLGPDQEPGRIWIQPRANGHAATNQTRSMGLTANEWNAISERFPAARLADASDTLFLCPPGVRVMMPGTGCPIRDQGIIVSFSPLRLMGDSVRAGGSLIQSAVGSQGSFTWMQFIQAVFEHRQGEWRFRGIRDRGIT